MVFTPKGRFFTMDALLAIVNGDSRNRIDIIPGGAKVKVNDGLKWSHGKVLTVTLEPFTSFLVRGQGSFTGTQIRSQRPVAVLAGHQCLLLTSWCELVYEQLPPVASLGKEYLLPWIDKAWAAIVSTEDDTEVTLHRGSRSTKQMLRKAGIVTFQKLFTKRPLVVESNKNVMVLLLGTGYKLNPFMITLTPTHKLATDWAVEIVGGFESTIAIVSEREGAGSVKWCTGGKCISPTWQRDRHQKRWVWANVNVGTLQRHVTVEGDAQMAVYVYGRKNRHAYGTAGICSEDAPLPPPPADPCEDMKCSAHEHCVKGACVSVSTATCRAVGDPHYLTFDGQRYDFQGTCTYVMATVAKRASDLVPFTVMTKNDHRGSSRVSFVRTVTVSAHNQTLVIGRHKGRVQVNGELQYLPVSLVGGLLAVKQSGSYAVVSTDSGLTVKYDWNMRLYITVPFSYHEHLGGLCGNYNGDKKDDLPGGSSASAVQEMVLPWKVKDSDPSCQDKCVGQCFQCSQKKQAHFRKSKFCGILTKTDGPFSSCHQLIEPTLYLDNCVYDICVNKGAKQILCDNLKSYVDACLSGGVKVSPEWRTVTKCPLPCPEGRHYESCGSACPASCVSPDEQECKEPCVEGCQCDRGLVLSGDSCVRKARCGCQYQGRYYPPATSFWGDNTCTTSCKCVNGKAKCKSSRCRKNKECLLKDGVRGCYPTSFATCRAAGDPHYQTFDNRRFDFQGTCTYILSQHKEESEQDLVPFQVLVQNENRGNNKAVAYTKSVSLLVFGNLTVSMSRSSPGNILVNSRTVNLPYSLEGGRLSVFRRGFFGVVTTDFGLTLKFNWKSHVSLTLPSSYSSATTGLCGNYNGKAGDDLLKPDGTKHEHIRAFGHSWKAGGDAGCTSDCPGGKCPECEPAMLQRYNQPSYCGIIANKSGPFRQCHSKLDHKPFLTDCVFDMCMYQGHASALCNSLSAFSTSCQDARASVERWSTEQFCPPPCGANSHYELCAPPCQLTCSGLTPPEGCNQNSPCTEGCVCDDGYVWSHDKCVPVAECGCQYKGQYFQHGQLFYPGESCNTRCVCSDAGEMECDSKFHCSAHEKCVVKDGSASCAPKSVGSCSVSGVREVRSFDGQAFPLWGNCWFKMSEVEEKDGGIMTYSLLIQQQTTEDGNIYRSVELQVYGYTITMESGVVWQVKVDDISVFLPVSLADGRVRAHQNGINIVIETDFSLKLTYDCEAGVLLQIPSTYHSSPRGFCGNYNDDVSDELPSGGKRLEDATAAWVETKDNTSCETGCGSSACPGPDEPNNPKAKKACKIIRAKRGPFTGCHSTVTPTPHYDACVREMSRGKADIHILCRHVQNYVTACQLAGAKISEWRRKDFCPVTCPAGSHYELCSSSCSSTCFSLEQSGPCPVCQEGCRCDRGLMSDGVACVPVEKCGCVVDGQYYTSGASVLLDDCSERCVCQVGRFSCSATSCNKGEECSNRDGTIGCYPTVPCAANSHYEECGTSCPASCEPPPRVCPKICRRGCFCDHGFVRSGDKCVDKETGCGCDYHGHYRLPGEEFWADSQCEEKCVCDAATQKVQCAKSKCRSEEKCAVVNGVQGCFPDSFKKCTSLGDPHYRTFDGQMFNFQGNCVYKLARVCGDAKGLQPFEVNVENNNFGQKKRSYAKAVTVKVYNITFKLTRDDPGRVLVNGHDHSVPFSFNQTLVQVLHKSNLVVIETYFLKVSFDFANVVKLELATTYQSATCGLCGNFNGDPTDDLMLPNGKTASSAREFGESQWLSDVNGCSHE
uniref:VWFD domain-containing protein n=1 Tax=Scophthalmus maximus TaxID=52904 RepID=A0A8D3DKZ4_SCOMX